MKYEVWEKYKKKKIERNRKREGGERDVRKIDKKVKERERK